MVREERTGEGTGGGGGEARGKECILTEGEQRQWTALPVGRM